MRERRREGVGGLDVDRKRVVESWCKTNENDVVAVGVGKGILQCIKDISFALARLWFWGLKGDVGC